MPQQLLHHLELSPDTSQQGRVSVPERMPSESLLNSDWLRYRTYVFAQDRLAPVRSSPPIALAGKNPVLRPDVGTTFSPLGQSVRESRMHWDRLLRCFGLAGAYHSVHDGTDDAHRASLEVVAERTGSVAIACGLAKK
jgi:hypothetical protein